MKERTNNLSITTFPFLDDLPANGLNNIGNRLSNQLLKGHNEHFIKYILNLEQIKEIQQNGDSGIVQILINSINSINFKHLTNLVWNKLQDNNYYPHIPLEGEYSLNTILEANKNNVNDKNKRFINTRISHHPNYKKLRYVRSASNLSITCNSKRQSVLPQTPSQHDYTYNTGDTTPTNAASAVIKGFKTLFNDTSSKNCNNTQPEPSSQQLSNNSIASNPDSENKDDLHSTPEDNNKNFTSRLKPSNPIEKYLNNTPQNELSRLIKEGIKFRPQSRSI